MRERAFTVVELLVVMAIILVLAGLILATSGFVHKKGARSRAEAEIAAMSAALENYKADNGVYPHNAKTDAFVPTTTPISEYEPETQYLYGELSGDRDFDRSVDANATSYFQFKPNMLRPEPPSTAKVTAIRDPFGNSYGYSTSGANNPTFDLWSVADGDAGTNQTKWVKNW